MRFILPTLKVFAVFYIAFAMVLFFAQGRFLFPAPKGGEPPMLPNVTSVDIQTEDGEVLNAWYGPATRETCPTILFFHGNGSRVDLDWWRYRRVLDRGFGILALSYRGYGHSTGKPSEKGMRRDADAAWAWLESEANLQPGEIVIHGHSLGSGVATQLAARQTPKALVLESPFYSLASVAQKHAPFLPVHLLIRHKFNSHDFISEVDAPILMVHGTEDRVVPMDQSERLFESAGQPKRRELISGGDHNTLVRDGLYEDHVWPFLEPLFQECSLNPL